MPTIENLNQETPGVPEPPHFQLSDKHMEVPAPSSTSIPFFNAALTAGLRTLQAQEKFSLDADDATAVNNAREAMYVFHSIQEAIRGISVLNMREYQAWQSEMEKWKTQVNNFGIGFAEDANPMPLPEDDDEEDAY